MTRRRGASRVRGDARVSRASACPAWPTASKMRRPCGNPYPCSGRMAACRRYRSAAAQPCGIAAASRRCRSGGSWCAATTSRREPSSRRARTTGQRTSCRRTFSAGASRRHSRKAVPIWASRRSGNGRTWRPSGPRRVCWACIRSWRCWRTACTGRVACQYAGSLGTTSSRRRSATPWQRCGTICGRLSIFQHPRRTPSAWKFPACRCSACCKRSVTRTDPPHFVQSRTQKICHSPSGCRQLRPWSVCVCPPAVTVC